MVSGSGWVEQGHGAAAWRVEAPDAGQPVAVRLSGRWHLQALAARQREIAADLDRLVARHPQAGWDLRELARLDSLGAVLLWRAWGRRLPARIDLRPEQRALFARLAAAAATRGETAGPPTDQTASEESHARQVLSHTVDLVALTGQCVLDLARVAVRPSRLPWRDLSAAVYRTGAQALPITALAPTRLSTITGTL